MRAFRQDLRFALRSLRRAPGFLIATVVTIALAIGATTAVITAVDRIVLRPLPFPESERTVVICETSPRTADFCVASPPNVADWRKSVPALESVGVGRTESALIERDGRPFGVPGGIASPGFFQALAARASDGRLIEEGDLHPSRNQVIVVSHGFWREQLGGRPDVVGSSLTLDGRPVRIIGVLAQGTYIPSFEFVQVWKPLTASVDNTSLRSWRGFLAVGRLARGAGLRELDTQLAVARARLAAEYPETNATWGLRTLRLRAHVVGSMASTLWIFLAAVGLLLIVACANVASLLLVRAVARSQEFAVRISLGAGRLRIIRQLLTESVVIAAIGGAIGLWLGALITKALVQLAPEGIPRLDEVRLDGPTVLFGIALTAVTAMLFGLAPAHASLSGAATTVGLKSGRQTAGHESRAHSLLVVTELTLSVMLLLTAGVLTRSFAQLASWNPGFERSNVSVAWLVAPSPRGVTARSAVARLEQAREAAAAIPGVTAAGLTSGGPLFGGVEAGAVAIDGRPPLPADQLPTANWHDVDPHFFTALGRRIVKGRGFTAADVEGAPAVAIVNESFAARIFGGDDPLGRRVSVQDYPAEIVGIVSDVRPARPDRTAPAEIFWPIRQYPRLGAYVVIRTNPNTDGVERTVKARMEDVDPMLRVGSFSSLDSRFLTSLVSPRFNMILIGTFALVASILAAIGVYGVVGYSVNRRTREIGVRIALGAQPGRLVAAIVMRVLMLASVGVALGIVLALAAGRAVSGMAYGVKVTDPLVLVTTIAGFLMVTVVAGSIPARRASRVDPLIALRSE